MTKYVFIITVDLRVIRTKVTLMPPSRRRRIYRRRLFFTQKEPRTALELRYRTILLSGGFATLLLAGRRPAFRRTAAWRPFLSGPQGAATGGGSG